MNQSEDFKNIFFEKILELIDLSKEFSIKKKSANSINDLISILFRIYVYLDEKNKSIELENVIKVLEDFINKNEKR